MKHLIVLLVLLSSCATPRNNPKKAAKHFRKFQDNGGMVICPDSIQALVIDDTAVLELGHNWICPEIDFPKSNVQIRQEERTERVLGRQGEKSNRTETKEGAKVAIPIKARRSIRSHENASRGKDGTKGNKKV